MPSLHRAVGVADILRWIRIDAMDEVRSCQPYLVVHEVTKGC
jgi:hypothetical protein